MLGRTSGRRHGFMSEGRDGAAGSTKQSAADLLAKIDRKRGYVLEFHRSLAAADPEFLSAYDDLVSLAYTNERLLSSRDKELAYVAMLTGLGAEVAHVRVHIALAKDAGASRQEILEVLEMCLPECGVPKFMSGIEAWRDVFQEVQ